MRPLRSIPIILLPLLCFAQSPTLDTSASAVPYVGLELGIGWASTKKVPTLPEDAFGPSAGVAIGIRHDTIPLFAELDLAYALRNDFADLSILTIGGKFGPEFGGNGPVTVRLGGNIGMVKGFAKVRGSATYFGANFDLLFNSGDFRNGFSLAYTKTTQIKVAEQTTYGLQSVGSSYPNSYQFSSKVVGKEDLKISLSDLQIRFVTHASFGGRKRQTFAKDAVLPADRFQ